MLGQNLLGKHHCWRCQLKSHIFQVNKHNLSFLIHHTPSFLIIHTLHSITCIMLQLSHQSSIIRQGYIHLSRVLCTMLSAVLLDPQPVLKPANIEETKTTARMKTRRRRWKIPQQQQQKRRCTIQPSQRPIRSRPPWSGGIIVTTRPIQFMLLSQLSQFSSMELGGF
jgi:hypothetical protein